MLRHRFFFLALFLLAIMYTLSSTQVLAQNMPKNNLSAAIKQIASLLTMEGMLAKSGAQFYQAGIDCHQRSLSSPAYFLRKGGVFFFFNDSLRNCYLGFIPSGPESSSLAASCIISDSQYEKMFTPWFLDGLKNYDSTKKLNATAQTFIKLIADCLQPTADSTLLSLLQEHKVKN